MDKCTKKKCDDLIHTKLMKLVSEKRPECVLCYISTEIEVDTVCFVNDLLSAGKAVYAPRCSGKEMKFIRFSDFSELKAGAYGILEPDGTEEFSVFEQSSGSLCIVPALSFSRDGFRLGYGGGYYDRFLKDYGGLSAGICYGDFIGYVPRESFDVPVQILITEKETIDFYCG